MADNHIAIKHVLILVVVAFIVGILVGSLVIAKPPPGKGGGGGSADQCNDHTDNDGDGTCDFAWQKAYCSDGSTPGDTDCTSKDDNDEFGSCVPACNSNSECGTNGYIGNPHCGADGNVYRDYQSFTCENAGKCSAGCNEQVSSLLWQNCLGYGCSNGQCNSPPPGNQTNST